MICQHCRILLRSRSQFSRSLTTSSHRLTAALSNAAATQSKPRQSPPTGPPTATSTSTAQPFSTPLTPSPEALGIDGKPHKEKTAGGSEQMFISTVPAGTPLKGLNFMKGGQDPVALEDHEYPGWLWQILSSKKEKGGDGMDGDDGDVYSKSKKQRRTALKAQRKLAQQATLDPELLQPRIPIYEQSIDLPRSDGTLRSAFQAAQAREDLTDAMRLKRRRDIKEKNFLKTMR